MGLVDKVLKGVEKVSKFIEKKPAVGKAVKAAVKFIVDNVPKAVEWVKKNIFENIGKIKLLKNIMSKWLKRCPKKALLMRLILLLKKL